MKYTFFRVACLCIFLLAFTGCTGGQTGPAPVENDISTDTGPVLLADSRAGLDALTGYHANVVNAFSGKQDGKEQSSRLEMVADMDRASDSLFVEQKQTGAGGQIRTLVRGKAGLAAYSRIGDETARCHVVWSEESQPPSVLPADVVPEVVSAEKAGEETVNGVSVLRYTLNTNSLGTDVETLQGSLWLAKTGGYVVKLDLTYSGGEKTFGKGRSGTQTISYELTKINANNGFALPAGCQPVLSGVPEMPGAKNVNRLPDTLRYTTDSTEEKVAAFYREQLAESVWLRGETHSTSGGDTVMLFSKVDEPLSLRVLMSQGKSGLDVSVAQIKPSTESQEPESASAVEPTISPEEKYSDIVLNPADFGVPEGVPVYPGAKWFSGYEGIRFEFSVTDPVEKVKEFYKTNLKKGGWTVMPGGGMDPNSPLMFQKNGINLIIQITSEEGGSRVALNYVES